MSKYLFTPLDIALFFDYANFTLSDEKYIRDDIWENRHEILDFKYRDNKYKFIKQINNYIQMIDSNYLDEFDAINRTLSDMGSNYEFGNYEEDENYIEAYFRLIKLKLSYIEGCNYIRLKLRTLLKSFGYKRRTEKLVLSINRSLEKLKLECSLKRREKCNLGEIDLDDMIIIRLKENS